LSLSAEAAAQLAELTGDAAQGRQLFLLNCAHCHGDEGSDLHNLHRSDTRIHEVITAGIKGEMPSFGEKLGDPRCAATNRLLANITRLKSCQTPPIQKPFTVADGATSLLREDKQPTTAVLLEMPARRFSRLVGEKMEDGSVSPLHA